MKSVWHGHSTRPSLPAGTARKGSGHLSGRRPLHLANARPFGRSKAPLGLLLLRKRELAYGRQNRLITLPAKRNRAFPTGNALLYISLSYVDFSGCVRRAHPIFVSSWLGVRQNAFTGSFSPWLHRGWFCAVPPSGRTIPPLQGRREQRRHWFWYPVRRSFPYPQRTA